MAIQRKHGNFSPENIFVLVSGLSHLQLLCDIILFYICSITQNAFLFTIHVMKMPFAHFVIKFMHFESHDFHVLLSLLRSIAVIYR